MLTQKLNPQQLEAVRHAEGPLMVVAGAGSGKTRVITCRIASLIQEQNVSPENILAITFTNKAAGEMLERVRNMLDPTCSVWISTFHAFCLKILRLHIGSLGFKNDFVIYDRQDQLSAIKQCLKNLKMNEEIYPPKTILHHIGGFKNDFLFPEDLNLNGFSYDVKMKAAEAYPHYQQSLKANNALDFDDLLILTVKLFEKEFSIRTHYNHRFRQILVDEFQDTNAAQYRLIRLLTQKHDNVCVVGDDDQSIYRWRGANIENILHFEKDYPGTTVIKLEENYRSTQNILKAADAVVKENVKRKGKTLWTKNETGEPVRYIRAEDETDEAETLCENILQINQQDGYSFDDIAILYRTNAQSRAVEDVLRRVQIPYQVIGGLKFYERKEIKDVLAYMRLALNPTDNVSLKRIINLPARGIGKTSIEKIDTFCQQRNVSFLEGARQAADQNVLTPAVRKKISSFISMADHLKEVYEHRSPNEFVLEILDRSGYIEMLEKTQSIENKSRIENIKELCSAVDQFTERDANRSLRDFLDTTTLASDVDNYDDSRGVVHLMTLHTCKGLEFKSVFIIGLENRLLPHVNSMGSPEEYEEERRLCYVGFTRARHSLWLSNAKRRRIFGSFSTNNPSEFLFSIPRDILQEISSLGNRHSSAESSQPIYNSWDAPTQSDSSSMPYSVGAKVIHPKFGSGVIIKREGDEEDLRVIIFFKQAGKKTLSVNHANLIVL